MNFPRPFAALSLLCFSTLCVTLSTGCSAEAEHSEPDHSQAGAIASTASSKWNLDNNGSEVSFVTVKAQDIAEAHTLSELAGSVSFDGDSTAEVDLRIDLASVETNIPIRNERMREFLFEIPRFPHATIRGDVAATDFQELPVGDSLTSSLSLTLDLHGVSIPITAEVLALRIAEDRLMVTSTKPVIINAASVGLVAGIDKLQQLASLPSISKAVPVSFVLSFVQ